MQVSQVSGSIHWVMGVNLVIWTGLFLYLRRVDRKLRELEATQQPGDAASEKQP